MHGISFDVVRAAMERAGHRLFLSADARPYNLNLVAIRSAENEPDTFNDMLCIIWQYKGIVNMLRHTVTTDPGLFYLGEKMGSPKGTAMVLPGQYPGLWQYGYHKGYRALQQRAPVTVLRDFNRDGELNPVAGDEDTGMFGINCHRAGSRGRTEKIGPYSAGCIVHADADEFGVLMEIVRRAVEHWPNRFTFTLLTESQVFDAPGAVNQPSV